MYEFEVILTNGKAWVYADIYTVTDSGYHFWRGKVVVKTFPALQVVSVKKTWPEATP